MLHMCPHAKLRFKVTTQTFPLHQKHVKTARQTCLKEISLLNTRMCSVLQSSSLPQQTLIFFSFQDNRCVETLCSVFNWVLWQRCGWVWAQKHTVMGLKGWRSCFRLSASVNTRGWKFSRRLLKKHTRFSAANCASVSSTLYVFVATNKAGKCPDVKKYPVVFMQVGVQSTTVYPPPDVTYVT